MNSTGVLTAAQLNREHLGLTIRVRRGQSEFTDVLRGVSHEADLIEERNLFQEVSNHCLGRTTTTLSFLLAGEIKIDGAAAIDIVDS